MSWLKRIFAPDLEAELARGEGFLEKGDGVRALEIARKLGRKAEGELAKRVGELTARARDVARAAAVARADEAESEGGWEDAADWLLAALEHCEEGPARAEIEERRRGLLARAEEDASPLASFEAGEEDEEEGPEHDLDDHYHNLVSTLAERLWPLYDDRPEAFVRAHVALNEGDAGSALAVFEELAAADSEDVAVRLERGRVRLVTGDATGAREDFEAVWDALGDEPLDVAGLTSVPGLWGEAMLAEGRAAEVVERLGDLGAPEVGGAELADLVARSLDAAGESEAARRHLGRCVAVLPRDPRFSLALAANLVKVDQRSEAIACLEEAVRPSCSGGSCGQVPKHLPSLRALASLHLDEGRDIDRARELLAFVAHARGGRLSGSEHALLARYYEQAGDQEAAQRALAEAERLGPAGETSAAAPSLVPQGRRAVL